MRDLISRQAAIDAFNTNNDELVVSGKENAYAVERYLNRVLDRIKQLPPIQPEPHWIPVTERLPEESGLYQVTDIQGHVVRYVFNANESSVEYWKRCVKAWMSLPEPYKGVTE